MSDILAKKAKILQVPRQIIEINSQIVDKKHRKVDGNPILPFVIMNLSEAECLL
jgi:hypothetical protein